mgnify:CR=1 FL=1
MEARISTERHVQRQQKLKEQVDTRVAAAIEKKGILIVFTGNGKGKSTAAFGTVTRAVGHGKTVGVAQYIKGQWDNGEYNLLQPLGVEFHIMGTGFTWETQNRQADIDAAKEVWSESKRMLADKRYDLVVLDELTYMLAYHYLDVVGLRDKAHVYPTTLSGGQQQRIAIARALCMQSKIILFDEPTSALDPETIQEVLDTMIKLADENITMVVVTHEMGFAREVATRVMFVDEGQIKEQNTPEELFSNPKNPRLKEFLSKML